MFPQNAKGAAAVKLVKQALEVRNLQIIYCHSRHNFVIFRYLAELIKLNDSVCSTASEPFQISPKFLNKKKLSICLRSYAGQKGPTLQVPGA